MENRVITVTQTASARVAADTVVIALSAVGEAKKYADAADKSRAVADAVVALLGKAFDVHEKSVNVAAVRRDGKITGYRAVRVYETEFDYAADKIATATDILSDCECEWYMHYSLKDRSMRERLIEEAVSKSFGTAKTIARAAGVKVGGLAKAECACNDVVAAPMALRANGGVASPELIELCETVVCSWAITD